MLAELFEQALSAIHSANHRVPSADGKFEGDGIEHDEDFRAAIKRLLKYTEGILVNENVSFTLDEIAIAIQYGRKFTAVYNSGELFIFDMDTTPKPGRQVWDRFLDKPTASELCEHLKIPLEEQ